jgi:hypothetical protein
MKPATKDVFQPLILPKSLKETFGFDSGFKFPVFPSILKEKETFLVPFMKNQQAPKKVLEFASEVGQVVMKIPFRKLAVHVQTSVFTAALILKINQSPGIKSQEITNAVGAKHADLVNDQLVKLSKIGLIHVSSDKVSMNEAFNPPSDFIDLDEAFGLLCMSDEAKKKYMNAIRNDIVWNECVKALQRQGMKKKNLLTQFKKDLKTAVGVTDVIINNVLRKMELQKTISIGQGGLVQLTRKQ